ncbi:hypothetical protein MNBD_IGNAVI01-1542 [hydrothermal vent metagenome]|uniref:Uncharacterized protein n=1 Tax=hydrothermal vent metagenome TaxID=652676 RepID=A0A3B1BY69_9ZZZZ
MNERFIYLIERYFSDELTSDEKNEFDSLLLNKNLRDEFEEQKGVKEVLDKMKLKNPSVEVWDKYWLGIYNKVERGLAWIAVSVGVLILIIYGSIEAVENFLADTQTPGIVKFGISALVIGGIILLFSVIREKLFTGTRDKYKEVQR